MISLPTPSNIDTVQPKLVPSPANVADGITNSAVDNNANNDVMQIHGKRNIKDLTLPAMETWLVSQGERPYRAKQIYRWLYQLKVSSFGQMGNVSQALRKRISQHFHLGLLHIVGRQQSVDGSCKYAFRLHDGRQVESVLMPNRHGYTACVSTQVGCAMGCNFCMTAKMGLKRNLSTGEIVQQALQMQNLDTPEKRVTNVVFMGMGEPLHNYHATVSSLRVFQNDHGMGLSSRRLTVSTSGLVPAIRRFWKEDVRANLAVSLNAVHDEQRSLLMPVNRRWPIAELLEACKKAPVDRRRRVTFEYVLLRGLTDSLADANRLVSLLHGFACKVNLIPYNAHPQSLYQSPFIDQVRRFQRVLLDKGLMVTVRLSKGGDIQAACGQLICSQT